MKVKAYGSNGNEKDLELLEIERRDVGNDDVEIDIHYCWSRKYFMVETYFSWVHLLTFP